MVNSIRVTDRFAISRKVLMGPQNDRFKVGHTILFLIN